MAALPPAGRPFTAGPSPALRALLAVATLAAAGYSAWLFTHFGGQGARFLAVNFGSSLPVGLAVAAILAGAARQRGSARLAWTLIALGAAAWGTGELLWSYVQLVLGAGPFPSLADAAYLLTTPLLAAGVMLLPRPPLTRARAARLVLDVGIVMAAAGVYAWKFVIVAYMAERSQNWLALGIGLVYPLGDVAVLSLAVFLTFSAAAGEFTLDRHLLILGLALFCSADLTFASLSDGNTYAPGGPLDGVWVWAIVCLAAAAATARPDPRPTPLDRPWARRLRVLLAEYMPYAAVVASFGLMLLEPNRERLEALGVITGTGLVTALVLTRQVLAHRENEYLTRELAANEARFRSLVQNATDIITVLDAQGTVLYESPSSARVLGWPSDATHGRNAFLFTHPDDRAALAADLERLLRDGQPVARAFRVATPTGRWVWLEAVARNLLDDPAVRGIVINSRDVTEREEASARLTHEATHDALTGLPNRRLYRDRLEAHLRRGDATGFAVAFLDLDHFKNINDILGHGAGDALLKEVAARMNAALRAADLLARVSGDEFALLLPDVTGPEAAEALARRLLDALNPPVNLDGQSVRVTASLGFAFYPADAASASDLMRNADAAMYAAKQAGRATSRCYAAHMGSAAAERRAFEQSLRQALEEHAFRVHYQPIVNLADRQVLAFEALLRWTHPQLGRIPPERFIPIAEDTGLIVPLGAWVLETACRDCAAWQHPGQPPVRVTVNVSAIQFTRGDFVETVAQALKASGLPPGLLELELTETALLQDQGASARQMARLRDLGVTLALDDFGTGYAGIAYLQQLPLDTLKIDCSLTRPISGRQPSPILRALVDLALTLGLKVVPEGIEAPDQAAMLATLGCHVGQGFLYSRAVPAEEVPGLLNAPVQLA